MIDIRWFGMGLVGLWLYRYGCRASEGVVGRLPSDCVREGEGCMMR